MMDLTLTQAPPSRVNTLPRSASPRRRVRAGEASARSERPLPIGELSTRASTGGCSTARRAAAAGDRDGSLALETAGAESAVCKPSGADTARCTYKVTVSRADAVGSPRGLWHVAVLATAKDGETTLKTGAADLTV